MKWFIVILLIAISVPMFAEIGDVIHCVVTDIGGYYVQCKDVRSEIYYPVFTWEGGVNIRVGYEVLIVEIGFQRYEIREILY